MYVCTVCMYIPLSKDSPNTKMCRTWSTWICSNTARTCAYIRTYIHTWEHKVESFTSPSVLHADCTRTFHHISHWTWPQWSLPCTTIIHSHNVTVPPNRLLLLEGILYLWSMKYVHTYVHTYATTDSNGSSGNGTRSITLYINVWTTTGGPLHALYSMWSLVRRYVSACTLHTHMGT